MIIILLSAALFVVMAFIIKQSVNKGSTKIESRLYEDEDDDDDEFRAFDTNVAGITYTNDDGSSRRDIAFSCYHGQKLLLVRELDNPKDEDAVKVMTEKGRQLGYLRASVEKELQATLKGTSNTFERVEAVFIESGTFEADRGREAPYCKISIRKYYKK